MDSFGLLFLFFTFFNPPHPFLFLLLLLLLSEPIQLLLLFSIFLLSQPISLFYPLLLLLLLPKFLFQSFILLSSFYLKALFLLDSGNLFLFFSLFYFPDSFFLILSRLRRFSKDHSLREYWHTHSHALASCCCRSHSIACTMALST